MVFSNIFTKIFKLNKESKNNNPQSVKTNTRKIDFSWLYQKKENRWDDLNRPIGYIVGVTPGFAQIQRSPETYKDLGLMRKYMKGALFGFEFVQLDFETISEVNERYLWKMIEEAKRYQGLQIGLHAPVTGEVAVDLGIAYANQWTLHHRSVQRTAYAAGEILGAKYFLFHSSSSPRPNIVYGISTEDRITMMRGQLFSYTGINLGRWIKQLDGEEKTIFEGKEYDYFVDPCYRKIYRPLKDFRFRDYFKARYLHVLFEAMGSAMDPDLGIYFYYYDSFDEGLKDAERYRKEGVNKLMKRFVLDVSKNVDYLIGEVQKNIENLENMKNNEKDVNRVKQIEDNIQILKQAIEQMNSFRDRILSVEDYDEEKNKFVFTPEEFEVLMRTGLIERLFGDYKVFSAGLSLEQAYPLGVFESFMNKYIEAEVMSNIPSYLPESLRGILSTMEKRGVKVYYSLTRRGVNYDDVFEYWTTIKGSESTEDVAYGITAKFMYKYKDYLWLEIVGKRYKTGINDAYDPDDVVLATNLGFKRMRDFYEYVEKDGSMPFKKRLDKYSKEFREYIYGKEDRTPMQIAEDIVTAVACKYIQGHLFVKDEWAMDTLPEWLNKIGALTQTNVKFNNESIWDYVERGGSKTDNKPILMFVETEQPRSDALAGKLRIMRGKHHIILVKSIVEYASSLLQNPSEEIIPRDKGPYKDIFAYNIDFEHLTTNLIDPVEDAKSLDAGDGKYVKMLHVNAPRPYGGQHGPLFLLTEELTIIYEWMWILRQKGMKNAYFIWEMGSYGLYQTAIAFRRMAMALEHDIPPEELPPEFYGIDEVLLAEQKKALIEHAYDPLEGMLLQPEEKHTFLGNAAREKGKLDKWAGEEHR